MAITTPDAVPGEVIEAAWGDAVRADLTALDTGKYAKAGGAITGALTQSGGAVQLQPSTALRVSRPSSTRPSVEFYNDPFTTRYAAIVGADTGLEVLSDAGAVKLMPVGAEQMRVDPTNVLIGKTAANFAAVGVEVAMGSGRIASTMGVANMNHLVNHISLADANGVAFVQFQRNGSAIGTISQVSTTGVAYGTTSDKRLKTMTRPVDPDEAVAKVAEMDPVHYVVTAAPADGEKTGFMAQDLLAIAPEAVVVGTGEPGEPEFVPWMVDLSTLVPTLVAAVQALTRRIEQLEAAP